MPDLETRPGLSKSGPAIVDAWACALGAMLLLASVAAALPSPMVHPNLARGDRGTFHDFPFDRVNTFNGNLRIDIPIGQSYPLSERFSYRLKLTYNSNAWDFTQSDDGTVTARPMAYSNAGMGWDLSFGRLVPPASPGNTLRRWIYVSPDGTAHPFYERLHHDVANEASDVWYSRDGTYLRLRKLSDTEIVLDEPSGQAKTFEFNAQLNEWRTTRIEDPFGNWLALDWGASDVALTDSHGRSHKVVFAADSTGLYPALVDRVELAAFAGGVAVYDFAYQTSTVRRPETDDDPETPAEETVPVLSSLTLPDDTAYSFEYGRQAALGGIIQMTLPTLGVIQWEYRDYRFQPSDCAGSLAPVLHGNRGISSRTTVGANGVAEGTWTTRIPFSGNETSPGCHIRRATDVITPLGDRHRYWFTVAQEGTYAHAYALPLLADHGYATGQKLSYVAKDCETDGSGCENARVLYRRFEQDADADPAAYDGMQRNRREAARRTSYRTDPRPNGGYHHADVDRSDFDGLGHYRVTETEGSFGQADYRKSVFEYDAASGSYPGSGWSMPSPGEPWILGTFTSSSMGDGTSTEVVDYCFDGATGLKTAERLRVSAAGPTSNDAITVHVPDSQGNVAEERYFGGDVQAVGTQADLCAVPLSAGDAQYRIRHEYQHGVRARSEYLDASGAPVGPPFLDRTIDKATGLTAQERNSAGIRTDVTYDAMGRVLWVKPEPGHGAWKRRVYDAATGPGWDSARTHILQYPNGELWPNYLTRRAVYRDGFGRVHLTRKWMPGDIDARTQYRYDAMGWLTKESEPHYAGDPVKWKQYLDRDPFGRARIERPPSGSVDDVTYEYLGIRVERRTDSAAVYHDADTVVREDRTTETIYDRQGRLWKRITYGSGISGSPDRVTEYVRDPAGRALKTLRDGERVGTVREYDGRGFLTQRRTGRGFYDYTAYDGMGKPREYTTHWYEGRTGSDQYYVAFRLVNEYDRAARLREVHSLDRAPHLLQEFTYADSNGVDDWRAGKLRTAKYHFDFGYAKEQLGGDGFPSPATVTETFVYGGSGGRISEMKINMGTPNHWESTSTTFAYDELGNVSEIGYPSGGVSLLRTRTVRNHYELGVLVGVDGEFDPGLRWDQPAGSETWGTMAYHANGMVSQIQHGNGVTYETTLDPEGIGRYGSYRTSGGSNWNLHRVGVTYDGQGGAVKYTNYFGEDKYLIPESPPQYQAPPQEDGSNSSADCGGHWGGLRGLLDPLGRQIAFQGRSSRDPECNPKAFALYTSKGHLYRLEDHRGSEATRSWIVRDFNGRALFERNERGGTYLRDFIYRGDRLLATYDKGGVTWHYHPAVGGGAVTDANGDRVGD